MLTEQEVINNAFKEMLFHEEMLAKKYADLVKDEKDPHFQKMYHEMEMAADARYNVITQKMSKFGIV